MKIYNCIWFNLYYYYFFNTAGASRARASSLLNKEKTPFDEPINLSAETVKGSRLFHITGHSYTRAIMYHIILKFKF